MTALSQCTPDDEEAQLKELRALVGTKVLVVNRDDRVITLEGERRGPKGHIVETHDFDIHPGQTVVIPIVGVDEPSHLALGQTERDDNQGFRGGLVYSLDPGELKLEPVTS